MMSFFPRNYERHATMSEIFFADIPSIQDAVGDDTCGTNGWPRPQPIATDEAIAFLRKKLQKGPRWQDELVREWQTGSRTRPQLFGAAQQLRATGELVSEVSNGHTARRTWRLVGQPSPPPTKTSE
jgi:hypothetical protein